MYNILIGLVVWHVIGWFIGKYLERNGDVGEHNFFWIMMLTLPLYALGYVLHIMWHDRDRIFAKQKRLRGLKKTFKNYSTPLRVKILYYKKVTSSDGMVTINSPTITHECEATYYGSIYKIPDNDFGFDANKLHDILNKIWSKGAYKDIYETDNRFSDVYNGSKLISVNTGKITIIKEDGLQVDVDITYDFNCNKPV